jgi:diacylglycerol kinase family enzyme
MTLRLAAPPAFEADGELHRARDAEVAVGILPGALRFVV